MPGITKVRVLQRLLAHKKADHRSQDVAISASTRALHSNDGTNNVSATIQPSQVCETVTLGQATDGREAHRFNYPNCIVLLCVALLSSLLLMDLHHLDKLAYALQQIILQNVDQDDAGVRRREFLEFRARPAFVKLSERARNSSEFHSAHSVQLTRAPRRLRSLSIHSRRALDSGAPPAGRLPSLSIAVAPRATHRLCRP